MVDGAYGAWSNSRWVQAYWYHSMRHTPLVLGTKVIMVLLVLARHTCESISACLYCSSTCVQIPSLVCACDHTVY